MESDQGHGAECAVGAADHVNTASDKRALEGDNRVTARANRQTRHRKLHLGGAGGTGEHDDRRSGQPESESEAHDARETPGVGE